MYELHRLQGLGAERTACVAAAAHYQTISTDFVRRPTDSLYLEAALLGLKHSLAPGLAMHLAVAIAIRAQIQAQMPGARDPVVMGTLHQGLARASAVERFRVLP